MPFGMTPPSVLCRLVGKDPRVCVNSTGLLDYWKGGPLDWAFFCDSSSQASPGHNFILCHPHAPMYGLQQRFSTTLRGVCCSCMVDSTKTQLECMLPESCGVILLIYRLTELHAQCLHSFLRGRVNRHMPWFCTGHAPARLAIALGSFYD